MRVCFLEPPLSARRTGIFPRSPPNYALYAAAVLREQGDEPLLLDAFLEELSMDQTVDRVLAARPDVVILVPFDYVRETDPAVTVELAHRIGAKLPGVLLGLAGSVDEAFLRKLMGQAAEFSFAACGEYERSIAQCARQRFLDLDKVPGLLVRVQGDDIVNTGPAEAIEDLDTLPLPAWDLVDFERYTVVPHRFKRTPMYPLLASRGCPYACTSCGEARYTKITRFRIRSVADVMHEIRGAVQRYGAREIQFADATFGLRRAWVEQLCDALEASGLNLSWSCLTRADVVTPDLLARMARAGCWNILIGAESANQVALDAVDKRIRPDQVREAVKWARAAGIEVTASFILGLPGEDRAAVLRTIDFACDLDPDYAQFFILKYWSEDGALDAWGRIEPEWDIVQEDFRGPVFVAHAFRDRSELKVLQQLAYRRFYLRPHYIAKRLPDLLAPGQLSRTLRGLFTLAKASTPLGSSWVAVRAKAWKEWRA